MNLSKSSLAAALALACAAVTPALAQNAQPPVEAFGSIPAMTDPVMSPDGKHVAVIQAMEGRPAAIIYAIDGSNQKPVAIPSSDWTIQNVQWAKNDRLLIYLGKNAKNVYDEKNLLRSWGRVLAVSPDGSNPVVLLHNIPSLGNNVGIAEITDINLDDPSHVYVPLWIYDPIAEQESEVGTHIHDQHTNAFFRYDLYRVDVNTGDGAREQSATPDTIDWYMDGHGHVIARLNQTPITLQEHVELFDNGKWKDGGTFEGTADNGAGIRGLSEDGKYLVVGAYDTSSRGILVQKELGSGSESLLYSDSAYDIDDALVDQWTLRVVGTSFLADKTEYRYFDPERQALQKGLEAAFPGLCVHAVSYDLAMDKVIAAVEGPKQPLMFYILDRKTHQALIFGEAYPNLHAGDLSDEKSYPYVARDGLAIPAYITLPPGKVPKNLPVVVMPHGGPDARDGIEFDWWAQFMANRGYAVLQPNFRGSSGYGHNFTEAGLQQWGLKMQDDISDGVKKLADDGIVDPKRVCIVGGSYGGYAALAGATFTPDLYACAVSVAGISDLPDMLGWERARAGAGSNTVSFWASRIGSTTADSDRLRATSPDRHADQVKCPVLLLHGDGDTTVPFQQSETMAKALTAAGKKVELIKLVGDDHYLELSATRIQMLTELEKFLKANIGQ
jgi:dipeptidyl aminopeptidase/acylaminoacyl peptidase